LNVLWLQLYTECVVLILATGAGGLGILQGFHLPVELIAAMHTVLLTTDSTGTHFLLMLGKM
jgi:hypothetical protein